MRGKRLVMVSAIALVGCSHFEIGSPAHAPRPPPDPTEFGRPTRHMTQAKFDILYHLAWPQTQADMQGTFGPPARVEAGAEVYKLVERPDLEIWILYEGTQATGYQVR